MVRRATIGAALVVAFVAPGCLEAGRDTSGCWPHPERSLRTLSGNLRTEQRVASFEVALNANAACLSDGDLAAFKAELDQAKQRRLIDSPGDHP